MTIPCLPAAWGAWAVVVAVLLGLLIGLSALMEWLRGRYERREVLRRVMPRRHVHNFRLGKYINGVSLAECACGETRTYMEPK